MAHGVGRYRIYDEIACGGMATVHLARLLGPVGFSRTVAIKRLHPFYAKDPEFVSMLLDEARLAARIQHPNVVATLDVVARQGELFLVMEYIHGESLSRLLRAARRTPEPGVPVPIALAIMIGVLHGLHAAHEARSERGEPLEVVHRDVSPQNVLVGVDGIPRVLDFGVAKAAARVQTTRDGQLKGKLGYMAPEQVRMRPVDRRADIFAAAAVLWEMLTGRRLFDAPDPVALVTLIMSAPIVPPSQLAPRVPAGLDAIVLKALERDRSRRFETARDMALALESMPAASARQLGDWVESRAGSAMAARAKRISEIESGSRELDVRASVVSRASIDPAEAPTAVSGPAPAPSTPLEQASEVTDLSVATPPLLVVPRRRRAGLFVALGAVTIGALAVGAVWSRRQPPVTDALPSTALDAVSAGTSSAAASVSASASPPEPLPMPTEAPAASAAPSPPKRAREPISNRAPATRAASDCNPPYSYDARGVKYYKPKCFK